MKRNRREATEARWISYIESRQAGNCESGSRAWSSAVAYVIAQRYAHNPADKDAWVDLAQRLQYATEANPVASVSIALCDEIMGECENFDPYETTDANCGHECNEDCNEGCEHECNDDDGCFEYDSQMVRAHEVLTGYTSEWSAAYEYATRGSFVRALNIPEAYHAQAELLSVTPYANPNSIIEDFRLREAYASNRNRARAIPRVDFANLISDHDSLAGLCFMSRFASDVFDSYAKLSTMSLTPTPSVSLLSFRRNPAVIFEWLRNQPASVEAYAQDNPATYRRIYATWLSHQVRDRLVEHATNTLYSYETELHGRVSQYELTGLFSHVRHNSYNVFHALSRLAQYANQHGQVTSYTVTSVSLFECIARALETRLMHFDISELTEANMQNVVSRIYYFRETMRDAWQGYLLAMRARYAELHNPATEATTD